MATTNMGSIGIEIQPNAIDNRAGGPIGQFSLQYGSMGETNFGQDRTLSRGFYLTKAAFLPIRTASAGWHLGNRDYRHVGLGERRCLPRPQTRARALVRGGCCLIHDGFHVNLPEEDAALCPTSIHQDRRQHGLRAPSVAVRKFAMALETFASLITSVELE